jgi:hypothetical protein
METIKVTLEDGKEIIAEFYQTREQMKSVVDELLESESKVACEETDTFLTEEEIQEEIESSKFVIDSIDVQTIEKLVRRFPRKKDGWLKQRTVTSITDVDICDYVTEFTNCWYFKRVYLRVTSHNTCQIGIETTQYTTN